MPSARLLVAALVLAACGEATDRHDPCGAAFREEAPDGCIVLPVDAGAIDARPVDGPVNAGPADAFSCSTGETICNPGEVSDYPPECCSPSQHCCPRDFESTTCIALTVPCGRVCPYTIGVVCQPDEVCLVDFNGATGTMAGTCNGMELYTTCSPNPCPPAQMCNGLCCAGSSVCFDGCCAYIPPDGGLP